MWAFFFNCNNLTVTSCVCIKVHIIKFTILTLGDIKKNFYYKISIKLQKTKMYNLIIIK